MFNCHTIIRLITFQIFFDRYLSVLTVSISILSYRWYGPTIVPLNALTFNAFATGTVPTSFVYTSFFYHIVNLLTFSALCVVNM